MKKWNLVVKVERCHNCQNCVIAARDEHVGNAFPGYAAPATVDTESPIRILRRVHGQAPMVEAAYLPVMCNHCDAAPCIKAGGDAVRKRADGIVIIDPDKARGRRDIVDACPYRAIIWNDKQQVPQTWIFDAHLLDEGWAYPRCQQACPTDVFEAVKLDDAEMADKARREGLRVLQPDLGTMPRVWYSGLERWEDCFIGGSVSARSGDAIDCIAGAVAELFLADRKLAETLSDCFGDFRFGGLPRHSGPYRVEVRHPLGCATRECELDDSVYFGEIGLTSHGAGAVAARPATVSDASGSSHGSTV